MKKQKKIKTCRYSDEFWKNVWYTIRYGDSLGDRITIPLLSLCILLCISFLIFLLTSCTADPLSVTAPEGTGTEGLRTPLTIGLLTIEGNDGYDGSVPATTRMATDPAGKDNAWEAGDCIAVSAPKLGNNDMGSKTLTATYVYTGIADNLWRQINPNDNSDPYRAQAEATDIYPLYIDDIDRNSGKTISVETYGGNLHWEGSITYTNQTTRKNYCLQNYLSCDNARIAEADNEIPGIKRGQLYAELLHRRVSIVVRVIDQTMPNVLPTTGEATLDDTDANDIDAVKLTLTGGPNENSKNNQIVCWRTGKATETINGRQQSVTTFRAYMYLTDVPGITTTTDVSTGKQSGTVPDGSTLGTLTFTPNTGSTPQTLIIKYSITKNAGVPPTITTGTRITVMAPFNVSQNLDATATLNTWEEIDAGDTGTETIELKPATNPDDTEKKGTNGQPIYELSSAQDLLLFAQIVNGTDNPAGDSVTGNLKLWWEQ